jgi:signal peptidase I
MDPTPGEGASNDPRTPPAEAREARREDAPGDGTTRRGSRLRRDSGARNVVEWVLVIVGAVLIALLVRTFVMQSFQIPSGSMNDTLLEGDRVLVNRLSYRLHDINRGDVVVFERPASAPAAPGDPKDLIKRVIGLPGEEVSTVDGVVHIDGQPLDEPYLAPGATTTGIDEPIEVPEGEILVLGDNRNNSSDGRVFGTIPVESVAGRAFAVIWPLSRFGGL